MAKYVIEGETLEGLANALRNVTGATRKYTPTEMVEAVTTIMETGTYILVDENGVEVPAVFVDNETAFTATENDIRLGKTAVTDSGVVTGEKFIPAYHTSEGFVITPAGGDVAILLDGGKCEYTKLQVLICAFNSTVDNSVATEMVSIDSKVYAVKSAEVLASVSVDTENNKINLGVANKGTTPYIVRFFTYKEE